MHFCSHPGVNGRLSREADTACLPCSLSCYEARPGVPMPTLAGIRAIFCGFALTRRIRYKTRPDRRPVAGSSRRTQPTEQALAAPYYAPQVLCCRTAHGGNTGLRPGYEEHTSD